MGRKRDFYIREYFENEDRFAKCKACGERFQHNFITNLKMQSAKIHLKGLVRRMEGLKENHGSSSQDFQHSEDVTFLVDESSMQSSSSLLKNCIRELELANSSSEEDSPEIQSEVRKAFYEIESYKEKRVDVDMDIIEYWNGKKYCFPWLRKLVFAIHSVPSTQVSVERSFSALKLILTDLRYNLTEKNLETICLLKLNRNIISHTSIF